MARNYLTPRSATFIVSWAERSGGEMLGPRAATRAVMRKLRADWSFGFNCATDPACCATLLPRPRHLSRAPFHGPYKMKSISCISRYEIRTSEHCG